MRILLVCTLIPTISVKHVSMHQPKQAARVFAATSLPALNTRALPLNILSHLTRCNCKAAGFTTQRIVFSAFWCHCRGSCCPPGSCAGLTFAPPVSPVCPRLERVQPHMNIPVDLSFQINWSTERPSEKQRIVSLFLSPL